MTVTTASIAYALKRMYPQKRIQNLVYQDNPLLALLAKQGAMGGSVTAIATRYGDTVAESADFAEAQTQSATENNKGVQFLLTRVKAYQVYRLETEAILAADNDMEAFVRSLDTEVESALNNFGRARGIDLYRDGVGERGQIAAGGVSGAGPFVFTLANPNDITNFEVGRVVVFSTGATRTAILRNTGGGVKITAVDRDAGTFTTALNPDSGAALDWVFFKGDRQVPAITAMTQWRRLAGLEGWNPAVAPTAGDNYFSQDRSIDASRLAGIRMDVSGLNPEEGLVTVMHRVAREGARPSHWFMNNIDAKNVHLALGSKAITEYTKVGDIGFTSIRVTGPKGDVLIYADQNAPAGVGRLLQLNTWKLRYLRELAYIQDMDGSRLSRVYNDDSYEGRIAFYGQLQCDAPGYNARVVLPPT